MDGIYVWICYMNKINKNKDNKIFLIKKKKFNK